MHPKTWAVAAALAFASTAVADGGQRIYFPRHVKRQFTNSTIGSDEVSSESATVDTETVASSTDASVTVPRADTDSTLGLPDLEDILTLDIPNTIRLPDLFTSPTATPSDDEQIDDGVTSTSTSPGVIGGIGGIIVAPTGVVTTSSETSTSASEKETPSEEDDSSTVPTETYESEEPVSTDSVKPTAPTSADPPSLTDILDPIESLIIDPIESAIIDPIKTGIIDPIETAIIDPIETAIVDPIETAIETAIVDPVETIISDIPIPKPTAPNAEPSDILTLVPIPEPSSANVDPTDGPLTLLPIPEPTTTVLPPISDPVLNGTEPVPPATDPTTPPYSDPTDISIPPTDPTDVPFPTGANVTSSAPVTDVPTPTTISDGPIVTPPPAQNSTIYEEEPTTVPSPVPNQTFTSIPAVTTVTGKENWLGTKLAADDATATVNTDLPAPTSSQELPAGMPNSIDATDDEITQPDGTTLIRIVFDRRLHYEFVAENFTASQQIFMYFPKVISHGESCDESKVKMMRLTPLETKQNKGWITTAAFAYVPSSIIEALQIDIHLTNSELYNPPHPIAFDLASAIDPSYGIFPGSDLETPGGSSSEEPGGAPFGGGEETPEEQTPGQKGATAGIAVGAIGAAMAYGAAMFLVARRYKRKKLAHRRASSLSNSNSGSAEMRFSGSGSPATAMMGGALLSQHASSYGGVAGGRASHGSGQSGAGNSGRTAYISAPVAAENSLGWN
ncbi:uncharacterized protein DNG_08555 [Cephalotrichum gorgonifer]|uniref:Uncharacterized protein n=1 Tax=Cephalotrichum gorgonifer TaxID=2041049 RepID=A0AAE8SYG7_9PEZI|nr:uncharacterized protein DNG_08555 [Cephalotrichum gorgonifer]